MKNFYIFLDIDGVLNSKEFFHSDRYSDICWMYWSYSFDNDIDEVAVKNLNTLLNKVENPTLVLSSDWRVDTSNERMSYLLFSAGSKYGITARTPFIDNISSPVRGYEVAQFIKENWITNNYIILDDVPQFLEEQEPHLILTDPDKGFNKEKLEESIELYSKLVGNNISKSENPS